MESGKVAGNALFFFKENKIGSLRAPLPICHRTSKHFLVDTSAMFMVPPHQHDPV
jgi:hypothetical protein